MVGAPSLGRRPKDLTLPSVPVGIDGRAPRSP
jgi:hypothetical protein